MAKNLNEWLDWQATLHPKIVDLGLERCREVAKRLQLFSPPFPIITVAGTNGKGSSVAMLEAILSTAGYRVGCYTSPHLLRYNERIRVDRQEVTDEALCQAFTQVEAARQTTTLTYFEFGTLAAMILFFKSKLDIIILEVGLGGRLDVVNLFDATVALITPIGIDHVDWLGPDRESIGFEKAGIFRTQQLAVCNDPDPPKRLLEQAHCLSTSLYCSGRDFTYSQTATDSWQWQNARKQYTNLPLPNLAGHFQLMNAAGVLMVLDLLQPTLPIPLSAMQQGLTHITLAGRLQILTGRVTCIMDVAHNPLGVQTLKETLHQLPCQGQTHALVGVLRNKDSASMFNILRDTVHHWHLAPLATPRGMAIEQLMTQLQALDITAIHTYRSIATAYRHLSETVSTQDRIVVFGSFFTVAEVSSMLTIGKAGWVSEA